MTLALTPLLYETVKLEGKNLFEISPSNYPRYVVKISAATRETWNLAGRVEFRTENPVLGELVVVRAEIGLNEGNLIEGSTENVSRFEFSPVRWLRGYEATIAVWGVPAQPAAPAPDLSGETLELKNGAPTNLVIGTPVYISATNTCQPARADTLATANAIGLCRELVIEPEFVGFIQTADTLSATPEQWDAVTGETGGLRPNQIYYLSPGGGLTRIPPTSPGQYLLALGRAITVNDFYIDPQTLIGL